MIFLQSILLWHKIPVYVNYLCECIYVIYLFMWIYMYIFIYDILYICVERANQYLNDSLYWLKINFQCY